MGVWSEDAQIDSPFITVCFIIHCVLLKMSQNWKGTRGLIQLTKAVTEIYSARQKNARSKGKAVVLNNICAGTMEVASWLRGIDQFFIDLALDEKFAG